MAASTSAAASTSTEASVESVESIDTEVETEPLTKDAAIQYDPPPVEKSKGRSIGVQVTSEDCAKKKTWSRGGSHFNYSLNYIKYNILYILSYQITSGHIQHSLTQYIFIHFSIKLKYVIIIFDFRNLDHPNCQ